MKIVKLLGEAIGLTGVIFLVIVLVACTINGVGVGLYQVTIRTNVFFEHWLELVLVCVGLVCYVKTRGIHLWLKRKKEEKPSSDGDVV